MCLGTVVARAELDALGMVALGDLVRLIMGAEVTIVGLVTFLGTVALSGIGRLILELRGIVSFSIAL